jgi:hypothetical protein
LDDPASTALLGDGWRLPGLNVGQAYELNVTSENLVGESVPYIFGYAPRRKPCLWD